MSGQWFAVHKQLPFLRAPLAPDVRLLDDRSFDRDFWKSATPPSRIDMRHLPMSRLIRNEEVPRFLGWAVAFTVLAAWRSASGQSAQQCHATCNSSTARSRRE